ncbi:MAG: conjugal transfer protein TraF [FCB group bacterium]|nr:conjugal transfer protein TraF [FCB group bacterium]
MKTYRNIKEIGASRPAAGKFIGAILIVALMMGLAGTADATGLANARATAMGGAYTSLAKGSDGTYFNPANLGFSALQQNGVQIVGVGVAISNNSFSLDDYNSYTGATLSQSDKDELLGKIPTEGLKVRADAEASVFGVSMANFAVSISAIAATEINLGRAPLELLLNGNTLADTIDLNGMYGEGYGLGAVNFSYGQRIYKNVDRQLSIGGTFKYLKGFGYEEVTEMNGEAVTLATGFEGAGSLVSRTATGGAGYALDLGASLQISRNYTVGVSLFNFLSSIKWDKDTEEHRFQFNFDTLTVVNMGDDDLITSSDTTVEIGSFNSSLPSTIKVGLAKTNGKLLWAVDWEQGFRTAPGSSTTPRISSGAEYRLLSFLPLRAGFALGGKPGTTFSGGMGFDLSLFYLDFAVASMNAISGASGKGLNFAVNTGLRF